MIFKKIYKIVNIYYLKQTLKKFKKVFWYKNNFQT